MLELGACQDEFPQISFLLTSPDGLSHSVRQQGSDKMQFAATFPPFLTPPFHREGAAGSRDGWLDSKRALGVTLGVTSPLHSSDTPLPAEPHLPCHP